MCLKKLAEVQCFLNPESDVSELCSTTMVLLNPKCQPDYSKLTVKVLKTTNSHEKITAWVDTSFQLCMKWEMEFSVASFPCCPAALWGSR